MLPHSSSPFLFYVSDWQSSFLSVWKTERANLYQNNCESSCLWPCDLCAEVFPLNAPLQLRRLCKRHTHWSAGCQTVCQHWWIWRQRMEKEEKWGTTSQLSRLLGCFWRICSCLSYSEDQLNLLKLLAKGLERDLAKQREKIQVQVWQTPITVCGRCDRCGWSCPTLMHIFLIFWHVQWGSSDSVVCVFVFTLLIFPDVFKLLSQGWN